MFLAVFEAFAWFFNVFEGLFGRFRGFPGPGYEHFTAEEVLRKLLPEGIEVPSSFEQAGHVAHLNLRAPWLESAGFSAVDMNLLELILSSHRHYVVSKPFEMCEDSQLPYKKLIGQVILDKNKSVGSSSSCIDGVLE